MVTRKSSTARRKISVANGQRIWAALLYLPQRSTHVSDMTLGSDCWWEVAQRSQAHRQTGLFSAMAITPLGLGQSRPRTTSGGRGRHCMTELGNLSQNIKAIARRA